MDVFWLVVVLVSWRVLTRDYWRTQIVPADARVWAWFAKVLPERGLLALYRATFFYGVCRMISWTGASGPTVIEDFPYDLSWTGPWWIGARSLPHVNPWIVAPVTLALLGVTYWVVSKLWEPMGRAEAKRAGQPGEPGSRLRLGPGRGRGDDVGTEHLDRVEVEAAQERHRGHVVGDWIGLVDDLERPGPGGSAASPRSRRTPRWRSLPPPSTGSSCT